MMTPPVDHPEDAQLRDWLDRYGPPPLPNDLHFDTARWVRETVPRRLVPRSRWGWSVAAAALFVGFAGGSVWLSQGHPPGSLAHHPRPAMPAAVRAAEAWLQPRTAVPVGAPRWFPSPPAGRPAFSATAQVTHASGASGTNGWTVALYATQKPWPLNSPHLKGQSVWLAWSRQRLPMTEGTATPSSTKILEGYNPLIGIQGLQVIVPPQTPASLGHGVRGSIETGGAVVWHQGQITGVVVGTQAGYDVQMARAAVAFIAQHPGPSRPTLIVLAGNQAEARFSGTWGAVDWLTGKTVTVINGEAHSPTTLWHVAVSWPIGS